MVQNDTILLTFDVEDWFQVENFKKVIPFSSWSDFDLRVEKNTMQILDCLDAHAGVKINATFFILGWIAKRKPDLIREIDSRGHEVASHGYYHRLCAELKQDELSRDLLESRKLLEDITGNKVSGYRSPSFSMNRILIPLLKECGYDYDSSYNSFNLNARYGRIDLMGKKREGLSFTLGDGFSEIPVSNLMVGKIVIPLAGGGYFRVIPPLLFQKGVEMIIKESSGYVFYAHPWEFDMDQPVVTEIPLNRKIRHYANIEKTFLRMDRLIRRFNKCSFLTCSEHLRRVKGFNDKN